MITDVNNVTRETLDMMKGSLGGGIDYRTGQPLGKDVTTNTGLTFYDLQAPSKSLYPQLTPIRNVIPRVKRPGGTGTATHWKALYSITGSGYDSMGYVPEGQRSGRMSYQAVDRSQAYITIGEEDSLTFQAESAAEGFEDENAKVTFRLLQKMMRKEEIMLLGGNRSLALGTATTPGAPTQAAATGSSIAAATYKFQVVALTLEGYKNSSVANGVAVTKTITGADGNTYDLNGGSSGISAQSAGVVVASSNVNSISCSVAPIQGAVAYAWFVDNGSTVRLQAITTVASVTLLAFNATSQQASAITGDHSNNSSLATDGLLTTACITNNDGTPNAYVKLLANGSNTLTASGRGSVVEIDDALQAMWDNYRLGPTVIYVSSQEQKNVTTKCLSNSTAPLLRIDTTPSAGYPDLMAGGTIKWYYNPFPTEGGEKIPVRSHPDLPAGTILLWGEKLPVHYQSNEVPNVAEVILQRDYYRMDWPLRTLMREYGVYAQEALAVYAPFAMGIIGNIANG